MSDPYKKLQELLSLPLPERGLRFQELVVTALAFFEKSKYILANGSPQEKVKALEEMKKFQTEINQELKRIVEQSGMTEEQLQQYLDHPNVLPAKEQEMIRESKNQIQKLAQDLKKVLGGAPSQPPAPEKEKKTGTKSKKQKWIKS